MMAWPTLIEQCLQTPAAKAMVQWPLTFCNAKSPTLLAANTQRPVPPRFNNTNDDANVSPMGSGGGLAQAGLLGPGGIEHVQQLQQQQEQPVKNDALLTE